MRPAGAPPRWVSPDVLHSSNPDKVLQLGGGSSGAGSGPLPGLGGRRGPPVEPQLGEEYPQALITTGAGVAGGGRERAPAGAQDHGLGCAEEAAAFVTPPPHRWCAAVDAFLEARDATAQTPHGGAALFLHALLNYVQPTMRSAGQQMLVLSMWEENLVAGACGGGGTGAGSRAAAHALGYGAQAAGCRLQAAPEQTAARPPASWPAWQAACTRATRWRPPTCSAWLRCWRPTMPRCGRTWRAQCQARGGRQWSQGMHLRPPAASEPRSCSRLLLMLIMQRCCGLHVLCRRARLLDQS